MVTSIELPSLPLSKRRRYCVARRPSVTLSRCVCVRHINLGGEGNALYPVLSSSRFLLTNFTDFRKITLFLFMIFQNFCCCRLRILRGKLMLVPVINYI